MAEDPLSQAIAFFRDGDPAKAEASCVIILQRNPGHAEANHLLGAIRFQQGRTAEAITFLKRAAASPLATAEIYNHLGSAHYRSGQREEAQDAFERAYKKWATWQPLAPAEAWVHRIAVNAAVSHQRKMRLREVGEVIKRIGRPGLAPDPQVLAENSDLAAALAKLPPKQAAAMTYSQDGTRRVTGFGLRTSDFGLGAGEVQGVDAGGGRAGLGGGEPGFDDRHRRLAPNWP